VVSEGSPQAPWRPFLVYVGALAAGLACWGWPRRRTWPCGPHKGYVWTVRRPRPSAARAGA